MAFDALDSYGALIEGGFNHHEDPDAPKAYLNILLFDKNHNFVDGAYRQLDDDFEQVGITTKAPHDYLVREVTITEAGYAYIFVSNENLTQVDVHFDDVKITHTHSNIVAGADYYPFGLAMDGQEIDDEPYRWGYQGQFAVKDSVTGWNEFDLRSYDPRIARWLSPDPYGQFASPYLGMGNAPHMGVDPDGGFWGMGPIASGAVIGAAAGTVVGLIVDPNQFYLYSLGGAGFGALGGAIYNALTYDLTGIGRSGRNPKYSGSIGSTGTKLSTPKLNFSKPVVPALETLVRLSREGHDQTPDDDPTWDTPTNRRTRELHPRVSRAARQLVNAVEEELGIQLRIVQGLRTIEEQNALYAQGRTTPGERVTNARGGQSYHNYGLAFDVVEMNNGRANWNTTPANWNRIRDIGQRFGLEWGGSWTSFVDRPHFQMTFGHTTRQLMQIHGVRIPVR